MRVEHEFSNSVSDSTQVGEDAAEFFDQLDAWPKKVVFQFVTQLNDHVHTAKQLKVLLLPRLGHRCNFTYLRVFLPGSNAVQVEQRLVALLFKGQRSLEKFQSTSPLVLGRLGNCLERYIASAHVLVLDQLRGALALELRLLLHPIGGVAQRDIGPIAVGRLKVVLRMRALFRHAPCKGTHSWIGGTS